jgi:hypothetical protein
MRFLKSVFLSVLVALAVAVPALADPWTVNLAPPQRPENYSILVCWDGSTNAAVLCGNSVHPIYVAGLAAINADTTNIASNTAALLTVTGAESDAACITDGGTCSLEALLKRANGRLTNLLTAIGSPLQAGVSASPGADASLAVAIQGVTGGKPIGVTAARSPQMYAATQVGYTAYATPTDMTCLPGSATKTVYPLQIFAAFHTTAAGVSQVFYIKRSTANSGGTASSPTVIPYDSANPAATTAPVFYTGAPSLGSSLGNLFVQELSTTTPVTLSTNSISNFGTGTQAFGVGIGLALHGTGEELCVNFNGVALPVGFTANMTWQWLEQ